jgi:hypothetical protein
LSPVESSKELEEVSHNELKRSLSREAKIGKFKSIKLEIRIFFEKKLFYSEPDHQHRRSLLIPHKQTKKQEDKRQIPQFTKELDAVKAKEGDLSVKLEVEFNGIPSPEAVWYKDGFQMQSSKDFHIESSLTSSSLVIREAFLTDSGMYQVKLFNEVGVAQTKAYLSVTAGI